MRRWIALGWLVAAGAATAQLAPPVRSRPPTDLVIATSPALAPAVRRAAAAVEQARPGTHIKVEAVGSDVAMAALYTARADAAVIGREAIDNEVKAYAWIYGKPPVATPVGHGSAATPGLSPALAIRIGAANPLRTITVAQLRDAFRIGAPAPTWGDLGLGGAWAARPVHLVIPDTESGTGRFLRHSVLADAVQFDWPRTTEVAMTGGDAVMLRSIDAAVARDPLALGIGAALSTRGVRSVALRKADGSADRLDRTIMLYTPADSPLPALLRIEP